MNVLAALVGVLCLVCIQKVDKCQSLQFEVHRNLSTQSEPCAELRCEALAGSWIGLQFYSLRVADVTDPFHETTIFKLARSDRVPAFHSGADYDAEGLIIENNFAGGTLIDRNVILKVKFWDLLKCSRTVYSCVFEYVNTWGEGTTAEAFDVPLVYSDMLRYERSLRSLLPMVEQGSEEVMSIIRSINGSNQWMERLSLGLNLTPDVPTSIILQSECENGNLGRGNTGNQSLEVVLLDSGYLSMCQRTLDDGGWIYIQRLLDHEVSFNRSWLEYKYGFGDISGSFYLGNEHIHQLTKTGHFELHFVIGLASGTEGGKVYPIFKVESEEEKYMLRLSHPEEDWVVAKNANRSFSTYDRDNDESEHTNMALAYGSGWWYPDEQFPLSANAPLYMFSGKGNAALTHVELRIRRVS